MIRRIMISGMFLIILTGCQNDVLSKIQPQTIEQIIEKKIEDAIISPQPEVIISNFKVLSIDDVEKGKIAIYRYTSQRTFDDNIKPIDDHNIGLAFFRQMNNEWVIDTNKIFGTNHIPRKIIYDTADTESDVIIFDQIIDSDVISITALFTNGLTVTKPINNQTFFSTLSLSLMS